MLADDLRVLYEEDACLEEVAAARTQLDKVTWAGAWTEGRTMTLEQAVAYALTPEPPVD